MADGRPSCGCNAPKTPECRCPNGCMGRKICKNGSSSVSYCVSSDNPDAVSCNEIAQMTSMRSATGGRKDRVATAVDWLTYII